MCIKIRPAKLSDFGPAHQLDRISFGVDAWTVLDYVGVFSVHSVKKFTALVKENFAGFAAAEYDPERKAACLMTIAVDPEYRQRGIGSALLKHCEDAFPGKHFYLNVDSENQAAIRFYEKAGYHQTGLDPAYYMNGHDAIIMEK